MPMQCRTCAAIIYNPNSRNIFDEEDDKILINLEILTGIRIKEDQKLPKHICTCCHMDLYYSIEFRERCLRTENVLQLQKLTPPNPIKKRLTQTESIGDICNRTKQQRKTGQEQAMDKTISTSISQRRSLRAPCTQYSNTLSKMCTVQNQSCTAKSSSVPKVDSDLNSIKSSPRNSVDDFENKRSRSAEALSETTFKDDASVSSAKKIGKSVTANSLLKTSTETKPNEELLAKDSGNVKTAANSKMFICDLCGHQSQSSKNLDIHILRHKGEKNFECEECGAKHYSKYLLKLHIRVKHQGEMPFVCKHCGQQFYSATERGRHEQVRHVRDFTYECKICGKKYLTKSCLNKHEFLHTGLRPYRCDLCNVAFPRRPGLKIHCRTKQHQKRASEALSNQLNIVNDITVPDGTIEFPDSIIEELVDV